MNILPQQQQVMDAISHLHHLCALNVHSQAASMRLSGIVCTIGPASKDPAMLEKMMDVGMNVARLNFSHGTHEYHAETIKNIRTAADNYSKKIGIPHPVAIALDTKGPEIRTGLLEGLSSPMGGSTEIELKKGELIKLTSDKAYAEKGNKEIIYVQYDNIHNVAKVGTRVYIDDGLICLIVENIKGCSLTCRIENGGKLGSQKGVHMPGVQIDLPTVSEKDKQDLLFGVKQGVDMVFASFVGNGSVVTEIRNILGERGKDILVIAKTENLQAMNNLDEIIAAADGILVDRGDLGMSIPNEKVFLAQKTIIARCNKAGKPIICATQMLESMVEKPRPTRAESTDVANAILDGADCVMLSGETAKGLYPLECVATMASICKEAEAAIWQKQLFSDLSTAVNPPLDVADTVAIAAVEASSKCLATAIIVITTSGRSARLISKYRPCCPIIAVTRSAQKARQAHIHRAILPLLYEGDRTEDWQEDIDSQVKAGIAFGETKGFINFGDPVVLVTGWTEASGFSDLIRIVDVFEHT